MIENLIEDKFIDAGDRIAVGVSGGADSMLLLCALKEKQKKHKFYLEAISVNHHLRGDDSDKDAEFVQKFCEKKKIDCKIIDVDVNTLKNSKKKTLEEAARIARYDAIYAEMKAQKLNKLFLAHHQNDQAETILMNIFRGSGIDGASGIKSDDVIQRPLLNLKKSEILKLCEENKISYVTDQTNFENDCTRNYMRNVVLPAIEKVYPDAVKMISLFGERCKEVQSYIENLIDDSLLVVDKKEITIKDQVFMEKPFLVREYLKRAFEILGVYADIEAKHYKLCSDLFSLPVNSSVDLPHGILAKRVYMGVKLCKKTAKTVIESEFEFIIGEIEIEGIGKIITQNVVEREVEFSDGSLYVDYYKIPSNSVWRFRKLGDTFAKLGTGTKKLNDYFTDKKIDNDIRDTIPILASDSHVLVVAGEDISENVKVTPQTDKIIKISFIKNQSSWQSTMVTI